MKLKYETPEITVIELVVADVITLSGGEENDFEDTDW